MSSPGPARKKVKTDADAQASPSRPRRAAASTRSLAESDPEDDVEMHEPVKKAPARGRPKKDASKKKSAANNADGDEDAPEPKKRAPRKKKADKDDDETFPDRVESAWKVGAHVSAAGGVENAVKNAARIGASAFALFLKSQRKWVSPPLTSSSAHAFKSALTTYNFSPAHILPHGSYLLNLGNPSLAKRQQSYDCFLDDLKRAEQLGLQLYNFHPGSTTGGCTKEESIGWIAENVNRALKETSGVTIVLENMAGQGNVIGSTFEDLRDIIALVEDKNRVGVCLDTCHMFAAGYDIRTKDAWEKTMASFDAIVGTRYLKAMHLNDSMGEVGCKKDRHDNLGRGKLGLKAFEHIVRDPRTQGIPLVLETPCDDEVDLGSVWRVEVGVLNELAADRGTQKTEVDVGLVSSAAGFESSGVAVPPVSLPVSGAVATNGTVEATPAADGVAAIVHPPAANPPAASTSSVTVLPATDEQIAEMEARIKVAADKANVKKAKPKPKATKAAAGGKRKREAKKDESDDDEEEEEED
ncbi:AP endonuclease [Exidia glandulosa HHB12029]|uniref:Apurinic-apyrimidinic endonuclease 1 n=1 Tax=Exidia glandulosa HHB12029 TaxID=1314781 RepID=A0A165DB56_EXIGL|nr:AP endonuclease [Exidia glandulosa HHB12029]